MVPSSHFGLTWANLGGWIKTLQLKALVPLRVCVCEREREREYACKATSTYLYGCFKASFV
jgi:hypothetical protein